MSFLFQKMYAAYYVDNFAQGLQLLIEENFIGH